MNQAVDNREKIQDIRRRLLRGAIDYEQARDEAQPIIDAINEKSAEIAKRHNMKAKKMTFAGIMR